MNGAGAPQMMSREGPGGVSKGLCYCTPQVEKRHSETETPEVMENIDREMDFEASSGVQEK